MTLKQEELKVYVSVATDVFVGISNSNKLFVISDEGDGITSSISLGDATPGTLECIIDSLDRLKKHCS